MLLLQYLRHTLEVVVTHLGVGDPRIALGSRHLTMAQEGLHRGDLSPVLQQLCGKGVTQAMTTGVYLRLCRIELEPFLDAAPRDALSSPTPTRNQENLVAFCLTRR